MAKQIPKNETEYEYVLTQEEALAEFSNPTIACFKSRCSKKYGMHGHEADGTVVEIKIEDA